MDTVSYKSSACESAAEPTAPFIFTVFPACTVNGTQKMIYYS